MSKESYVGISKENLFSIGWSHGYQQCGNDYENLILSLCGSVSREELIECVSNYLEGYNLGVENLKIPHEDIIEYDSENGIRVIDNDYLSEQLVVLILGK